MKFVQLICVCIFTFSVNAFAELPFKVFAEPYLEKSVSSKSQKIGNIESQYGDSSTFSLGSRLGIESMLGIIGGVGFDYTSAIVSNSNRSNSSYDLSFQSVDAFLGIKFLDIFKVTYARSISGKESAADGANRDVRFSSNKISLGVLLNKKAYLEISRSEKYSELATSNASVANRADLYDTYSIGLSYPIELF